MKYELEDLHKWISDCDTDYFENAENHEFFYSLPVIHSDLCNEADCLYILEDASILESICHTSNMHFVILSADINQKELFLDFSKNNSSDILAFYNNQLSIEKKRSLIFKYFSFVHKLSDFSDILFSMLYEDASIQHLVDTAYPYFNNSLCVFDTNFELIAANWNIANPDPQTKRILFDRHLSDEDFYYINKYNKGHERIKRTMKPVYVSAQDGFPEHLIININHYKDVGHISLTSINHSICKTDYPLLTIFRNAIDLKLKDNSFVRNSKGFNYEYFLMDLLDGKITIESKYANRFSYLSCKFSSILYCIVIETSKTPFTINILSVRNSIEKLINGLKTVINNGQIIGIVSNPDNNPLSSTELNALKTFCIEQSLYCGISNPFDNIFKLSDYYGQALRAIELGADNAPGIFLYENNVLRHVKNLFLQKESFETFCHPQMKILLNHDKEKNTKLAETLYFYLSNDRNLVYSAKALKIHKNTMVYRLNKINDLVSIDYEDPENRLYLIISYKFSN